MTENLIDRLDQVLAAAGPAHHAAFAETNGSDPEWALWYAHYTAAEVRSILDRLDLTESRLVWAFVSADDAHTRSGSDVSWHRFSAEWFAARLTAPAEE